MQKFVFGTSSCEYDLIRQERTTLSLTVKPDLSIHLKAPYSANNEQIEDFLKRKWFWLQKQINFFEKFQNKTPGRDYVSGESYWYLGRQYKLEVISALEDKVVLQRGKMLLFTTDDVTQSHYRKNSIETWYLGRARQVLTERYSEVCRNFDYEIIPRLSLKVMPKRWGSFISSKYILLNPSLIHSSQECIDYVITHELCHMVHKNHNSEFYRLLELKLPNWERVKEKLELSRT